MVEDPQGIDLSIHLTICVERFQTTHNCCTSEKRLLKQTWCWLSFNFTFSRYQMLTHQSVYLRKRRPVKIIRVMGTCYHEVAATATPRVTYISLSCIRSLSWWRLLFKQIPFTVVEISDAWFMSNWHSMRNRGQLTKYLSSLSVSGTPAKTGPASAEETPGTAAMQRDDTCNCHIMWWYMRVKSPCAINRLPTQSILV